jgi:hypothetical protein
MWVVVFVMAAGPLPLGIRRAEAQTITDTPGIKNFFTPKLFIIFDTSKSMTFRPGDINGDTSAATQDWDPNVPTPPAQCESKWCLGKRALYKTLPTYTSRIEMGLVGYNQYFELVTEPANFTTTCSYDRIAYGYAAWGNPSWMFTRLDDLTGTGEDPTTTQMQPGSIEISYQSPASPAMLTPHRVRKWGIASGAAGDRQYINVLGRASARRQPSPSGATATTTAGGRIPAFAMTFSGRPRRQLPGDHPRLQRRHLHRAGHDLTLEFAFTNPYADVFSSIDLGPTTSFFGVPYTQAGLVTSGFNSSCGLGSPYTGPARTATTPPPTRPAATSRRPPGRSTRTRIPPPTSAAW